MIIRSRAATVCLIAGTLLFAASDLLRRLVAPDGSAAGHTVVRLVRVHPGTWTLAAALALLSAFVLVAGLPVVSSLAPDRGRSLTRIGQWLFGAGVVASVAHALGEFGVPAIQARAGLAPQTVDALAKAGFWPWDVAVLVFIAGFMLGPVLMLAGLRRARVVPVWSPVGAIVASVCGGASGVLAGWVGIVAWAAAFGPLGVILIRGQRQRSRTSVIRHEATAEQ
jgi:hypothetical protein